MVSAETCGYCLEAMSKWKPMAEPETARVPLEIVKMKFIVDDPVTHSIPNVRKELIAQAQDLQMDYNIFVNFGKEKLKEWRIHPDAFVQIMIQAAAFKTHKRLKIIFDYRANHK